MKVNGRREMMSSSKIVDLPHPMIEICLVSTGVQTNPSLRKLIEMGRTSDDTMYMVYGVEKRHGPGYRPLNRKAKLCKSGGLCQFEGCQRLWKLGDTKVGSGARLTRHERRRDRGRRERALRGPGTGT